VKPSSFKWIRGAWILLAILSVATFVMSVPLHRTELQVMCPSDQPTIACTAFQLDSRGVASLQALGLTLPGYALIVSTARVASEVVSLLIAILIFRRRSQDRMALLVATMLVLANVTLDATTPIWARLHPGFRFLDAFLLQAQPITVLTFLFLFPDWRFVPRWTAWLFAASALAGLLYVLSDFGLSSGTFIDPRENPTVDTVGGVTWLVALLTGMGSQIYRYLRVSDAIQRQQTKWVVVGVTAALLMSIPAGVPNRLVPPGTLTHIVFIVLNTLSFSVIAIALGIAIHRARLWDMEVVVNRALIYGPLSAILAGVFAASVAFLNQFAKEYLGSDATMMAAVISALVVASVFQPLRGRIERWINSRWYPDSADLKREFVEFSPEVRAVIGLKDVLAVVAAKTVGLLAVRYAAILIAVGEGGFLRAEVYPAGSHGVEQFRPDAPLLGRLQKGSAVSKPDQQGLWVPLYLRRTRNHDLLGILDVGPRTNGMGFSSDDKNALGRLGAEIGTSIYTAQLREKTS